MGGTGGEPIDEILRELETRQRADAWSRFLRFYGPVLQQVVHLIAKEDDRAADCFLYICEHLAEHQFRRLRRFQPNGAAAFTTWLRSVSRNLSIDWYRKVKGHAVVMETPSLIENLSEDLRDPCPSPEAQAASRESEAALRRAIAGLPHEDQVLISLRFEQELTLDQIARMSGLKDPQSADRRIRQVLESIRKQITRGGKPVAKLV